MYWKWDLKFVRKRVTWQIWGCFFHVNENQLKFQENMLEISKSLTLPCLVFFLIMQFPLPWISESLRQNGTFQAVLLWTMSGPSSATQDENCTSKLMDKCFLPQSFFLLLILAKQEKKVCLNWIQSEEGVILERGWELTGNFTAEGHGLDVQGVWAQDLQRELNSQSNRNTRNKPLLQVWDHWNESTRGTTRRRREMQGRDSDLIIKKWKQNNTQRQQLLEERWKQRREKFRKGNYNQRHKTDKMGSQMRGWSKRETKYMKTRKFSYTKSLQKQVRQDRRSRAWKQKDKRTGMEAVSWEHKDQGFLSWGNTCSTF